MAFLGGVDFGLVWAWLGVRESVRREECCGRRERREAEARVEAGVRSSWFGLEGDEIFLLVDGDYAVTAHDGPNAGQVRMAAR